MVRFAAAEALLSQGLLRKASAARALQEHPPLIGKDPGTDSEVPLPPCAACAAAEAPCPACAMGSTMLASVVGGNGSEPDLSTESLCDWGNDEGFPVLRIGDFRPAVSVAQFDLNNFFFPKFSNCKDNPSCSSIYQPEKWAKIVYHFSQIKQLPLAEDCSFGPDTWHATQMAQIFFFRSPESWDGVIGCQTWRAIDPQAPSCA